MSELPDPPVTEVPHADENIGFGRYLARAREKKALSLDDLAHLTKIRRAIVESLERDARKELPEKVFVVGYVRSYAAVVGLDVEEAVRRFNASWIDEEQTLGTTNEAGATRSLAWLWPTLAALVAIAVIWFIINLG